MNAPTKELSLVKEERSDYHDKFVSVAAIEKGTVIDHIPAGKAILLLHILALGKHRKPVTLGLNLPSTQMQTKDLIKIEGRELCQSETAQIAIFAPRATISIIENYRVAKKYLVSLPKTIEHFVICPNASCITNHEKVSRCYDVCCFRKEEIHIQCRFCEKMFNPSEINSYSFGTVS